MDVNLTVEWGSEKSVRTNKLRHHEPDLGHASRPGFRAGTTGSRQCDFLCTSSSHCHLTPASTQLSPRRPAALRHPSSLAVIDLLHYTNIGAGVGNRRRAAFVVDP
ncbi:uncharacterized protein FOMMEDRAFT_162634 [Fomitiporia mediterranea MF3/22]|uniref:Uncharacterized protein n=1 Tax=Fomitiporia mediterranea (strain MF3/22) TaxID=694068 RepID=R7SGS3_FOMME|nr:uncharacterized protein FOMMEDRAFT_162634 [Fomitiporia mediterranea MF3/22]EJC97615.1 hypothetical protein FOMMEDRAFT_162634 [Fomitiporia mediterranea MF3/22]